MSEAQASYEPGHVRLSKREASLAGVALLSLGGFATSFMPHVTDANAAVVQRLSAAEAAIKAGQDDHAQDRQAQQEFRAEVLQRLGALDGRTIDTYHVLLDLQQRQAEGKR